MRISAPSSSVQSTSSGLSTTTSPTVWMSPAVTVPGPCFFTTMRLGPSPCILIEMSLMFSTMSVTSSRTPAIEENSCSTPSICTDCTAAPCSEDNRMRRNALPSVTPKPRSSGSATTVATRAASPPTDTWSLFGLISSCQFFWITSSPFQRRGLLAPSAPHPPRGENLGGSTRAGLTVRAKKNHTRRRFRGRQPLCGIVVTSRIEVIVKPAACSDRRADSRPEPGPETSTSRVRMPCSCAFLATSSAATCAAYGVDLREPLKPIVPADDQAIALPCASVMVMVVLLNDEFTCAMPEAMFLRSRRRTRVASLPIDYLSCDLKRRRNASGYTRAAPWQARPKIQNARLLLLAGDRLGRTLARARVGVGTLAAHRQAATMAQAAIAAEVHQTLDVDADLAAQVALDEIVAVDHFADLQNFLVGELADAAVQRDLHLLHDLASVSLADTMDVLKRDQHALVGRDVDAGDTGHGILSCHRHEAGISNCVSSG